MGNPPGVRRDFEKLEERRLEAAELLRQGIHQAEVARRVGVHRQSVGRWAQELEQGGKRALRKAGRAGRRPRLHPEDLRRIEKALKTRSGSGSRSAGRRLKKSPKRGPYHRLHRRKRIERTTPLLSDLGTAGTDADPAISL